MRIVITGRYCTPYPRKLRLRASLFRRKRGQLTSSRNCLVAAKLPYRHARYSKYLIRRLTWTWAHLQIIANRWKSGRMKGTFT